MSTYKAGYKTSEFWFTAVSFIFSGLYLIGIIGDNSQKEDLIRDVSHGVESIILIGGQLLILWKYIKGRSNVKQAYWNSRQDTSVTETIEVVENVKPRTNPSRNRKTNTKNKRKSSGSKKNSNS
jgi:hypothetical protein